MAKKKLNPEERLAEALIPVDEQPYVIPSNWEWVKLGSVSEVNPKKHKPEIEDEELCSFLPMRAISDETGTITAMEEENYGKLKKGYTSFLEDDVLFAKVTPCMENGKMAIAKGLKNGFGYGTTEFHVLRADKKRLINSYLYRFVRHKSFREEALNHMTGSVGLKRVPKDYLKNTPFPLPPLSEQRRIVTKVESMLEKIKEVKALISDARETFELRRASILHKAFTGELTAQWREEVQAAGNQAEVTSLLDKIKKLREEEYEVKLEEWKRLKENNL